ncbi:Fe-S cluster assembly ATPase SufC [Candidatus Micrarchaeota archaeon]|nr:Fe-S cluster assembly ATPase SufC [Candidatus Micrarchaeota archaeon]
MHGIIMLKIEKLSVNIEGKHLVNEINMCISDGEMHVIMGPNGSGKTTLAYAIAGHPKYQAEGKALLDNEDLLVMKADERARKGVFLAFQNPPSIEGVGLLNLIRKARNARGTASLDIMKFSKEVEKDAKSIKFSEEMLSRDLNVGLSGGEKRKSEVIQMLSLDPKLAILDEIDSGLDVDALKTVAKAIEKAKNGKNMFLIITHNAKLLKYLKPDFVHIMVDGRIVKSGDAGLSQEIEKKGYEWIKEIR